MDVRRSLPVCVIAALLCTAPARSQDAGREAEAATAARIAKEADALFEKKDFAAALKLYESERDARARLGDLRYEAHALRGKGCCLAELGDDPAAIAAWEAARAVDLKRDDPGFAGYDDLLIARAQVRLGKLDDAARSLNRAVPRLSQAVDRDHLADARLLQAQVALEQDRPDDAVRQGKRALDLAGQLKDPARQADARAVIGVGLWQTDELEAARASLEAAQAGYDQLKRVDASAGLDVQLGNLMFDLKQPERAAGRYESAARKLAGLDAPADRFAALRSLATLRLDLRQPEAAEKAIRDALTIAQSNNLDEEQIDARVILARSLDLRGRPADALAALRPAIDSTAADLNVQGPRHVMLCLQAADYAKKSKNQDAFKSYLNQAEKVAMDRKFEELIEAIKRARGR